MFIVIFLGLVALDRLNTQFLPEFDLNIVTVSTPWDGASAEDVQDGLAVPIEQAIMGLTDVDRVTTTSIEGRASMTVTLKQSSPPLDQMITEIEKSIAVLNLPEGVGDTLVEEFVIFDPVADLLLYGDLSLDELQGIADSAEKSLKAAGITKVDIIGLPDQVIEASLPAENFLSLETDLSSLGQQIAGRNINVPAGITGEQGIASQLRIRNEAQESESLGRQIITVNDQVISLNQIANVTTVRDENQARIFYQDLPAVKLSLSRAAGDDTLEMAEILASWRENFSGELPSGVQIHIYNEAYEFVRSRVNIILENGLGGMVLVLIILFLFLNHRLAWWVAAGVPVSFLGTFIFLELTGNSINVISLLGFLIALGVIVDDAIVVGENAYANMEQGDDPETAAIKAAKRMLPAVFASSITTIAAFLPLLLVGGTAGAFTKGVPIVVIMAIAASLIECFIILPGHLAHSFKKGQAQKQNKFRAKFEQGFEFVRQRIVRKLVTKAVTYRATTFSFVIMALVLAIMLMVSGRVKFVFFPAIEQPQIQLRTEFSEDTTPDVVQQFLKDMQDGLYVVEAESGESFIETIVLETNSGSAEQGALFIQLNADTNRKITNDQIIKAWRAEVDAPAGLKKLNFVESQQGPSTNGINIRLVNEDLSQLQQATELMKSELAKLPGLIEIEDDIPLGSEQLNLVLTPDAEALGITPTYLGRVLREFVDGYTVQSLQVDGDELDVVLRVEERDINSWFALSQFPIALPSGDIRPLAALATPVAERAIQQLSRVDGELSAVITAKRADRSINLTEVNATISSDIGPLLRERFPNVRLDVEGDQASQAEFFADVKVGGMLGLLLIFIALAWVFESWSWPFAVISAIPFALTGAIFGHWVLGLELSVLSIYGLFGLSGIIINDSIVLVTFYRELRAKGMSINDAVIEASVQRFRAVLLTTLTTVGGLTPLMFETSFDAQFLIPLGAGIAFGLMYGIVLILLFVPAMLVTIENIGVRLSRKPAADAETAAPVTV
jgi:multidrug efflux pump subunit AcrB